MQSLGFKLLNMITWEKPNPPPNLACRYFTHSTETLIWAAEGIREILRKEILRVCGESWHGCRAERKECDGEEGLEGEGAFHGTARVADGSRTSTTKTNVTRNCGATTALIPHHAGPGPIAFYS